MLPSLENCHALITGASSGIGREIALQLAPLARTLILVARRTDRLAELKSALEARHPGLAIHIRTADLSSDTETADLIEWLQTSQLPLSLLVNNAGVGDHGTFAESHWPKTDAMIRLNITALTRLTHALLPLLAREPRASILNISSVASLIPVPGLAVYAATKAYVTSLTESLRLELRHTHPHIGVTALCPGPVPTEFGDSAQRPGGQRIPPPGFLTVPVEQVAAEALLAVVQRKPRHIPGLRVAIAMTLLTLLPLALLRLLLSCKKPA